MEMSILTFHTFVLAPIARSFFAIQFAAKIVKNINHTAVSGLSFLGGHPGRHEGQAPLPRDQRDPVPVKRLGCMPEAVSGNTVKNEHRTWCAALKPTIHLPHKPSPMPGQNGLRNHTRRHALRGMASMHGRG